MRKISVILSLSILMISCGTSTQKQNDKQQSYCSAETHQKAFLKNLASLCGKSFQGRETFTKEGRNSWAHMKFVMHVTVCDEDKVYIPFHLDEDRSRTWMFIMEKEGLRFRHDHRHEDGTPEDQTLYGGYADSTGTAFKQSFPWDEYTQKTLADGVERKWNVVLAEDLSTMKYQLEYGGELVFEAEFDLTQPI
ncbi:MAG: hypothetical protein RBT74_08690 [Tenuifilaceae bacterium]|jgi:hypothetical protein|nr:hypothetical protein [Tenuifilaceae bacterium]